jgi:HD-GYP domain-containing protein (c-di-GMP phosphodiesterase class II)
MDDDALRDLRYGAIFHDIGKIAISRRDPDTSPDR